MDAILHSFLCGLSFVGGGAVAVVLIALATSVRDKASRQEIADHWKQSLELHREQVSALVRMMIAVEQMWDESRVAKSPDGDDA